MPSRNDTVSDYMLERYVLGELPPEKLREIGSRIEAEPALAARVEALAASSADILRQYPPSWFAGEVAARTGAARTSVPTRRTRRVRVPLVALVPALSVALVALWVLRPADDASGPVPRLAELAATRSKGLTPRLTIYRRVGDEAEPLDSTSVVRAGDLLQLSYIAAGQPHGVIVSIDGRGATTLHFPMRNGSTALRQEGETPLPHAFEIDDAPEFERFFLVTGSSAIDVGVVVAAAQGIAQNPRTASSALLVLPDSLAQHSVIVHKEEVRR